MQRNKHYSRLIASAMAVSLLAQGLAQTVAVAAPHTLSGDIRITVSPTDIQKIVPIAGSQSVVNMSLHGVPVQDALRAIAKKGGFNILIDNSVQGTISVDLKNVSIQDALDTIKTYRNLAYSVQKNTLVIADAESERGRSFGRSNAQMIPLRYASASTVSNLLNRTVFGSLPDAEKKVSPDFHTNSLLVVGTPTDIKAVEEHVAALDQPRESKTWRLSQANVLDAASIISSSLLNEGMPNIIVGNAGGAGASAGSGTAMNNTPTPVPVLAENIQEGSGATQTGGSDSTQSVTTQTTLRARIKEAQSVQISPNGALLIPDTRLNTLTLMGTAEQIAMVEAMIPTLDRKLPQVVMEVSLIELRDFNTKNAGFSYGGNSGNFAVGHNNRGNIFGNNIGIPTPATPNNLIQSIFQFTSQPIVRTPDFNVQLDMFQRNRKAKILASPTLIASHDQEASVALTEEVLGRTTITRTTGLPDTVEFELVNIGVTLNVLPKIGADGSILLRAKPSITTVAGTYVNPALGVTQNLLSKRELLSQSAVLKDGESFVMGGLIQDTDRSVIEKIPGIADLPILGALGRSSLKNKNRTELIIVLTPHIMNDQSDVARASDHNKMVPVNLKKSDQMTADGFVPVAETKTFSTPSILPPLEPAVPIGNFNGRPTTMPELGSKAAAAGLRPARPEAGTMLMLSEPAAPKASVPDEASPLDDAVEAIMKKFNK